MMCQRWGERRDRYRPAGETIRTSEYDVAEIADDTTARRFVETHHYSATYPAARWRFGLYRRGALVGVAVFSVPANDKVITNVLPVAPLDGVELGRFVLLDEVPGNGETWFLGRCFALLRGRVRGVVSFADPLPRHRADGSVVMPGHVGTIYQAHNGRWLGRSTARTLHLLDDGTVFSARAAQKIRRGSRGWRYAVAQLVAAGAAEPDGDLGCWLRAELPRVSRRVRHPGNHRYVWPFDRRIRRDVATSGPYPKFMEPVAAWRARPAQRRTE